MTKLANGVAAKMLDISAPMAVGSDCHMMRYGILANGYPTNVAAECMMMDGEFVSFVWFTADGDSINARTIPQSEVNEWVGERIRIERGGELFRRIATLDWIAAYPWPMDTNDAA